MVRPPLVWFVRRVKPILLVTPLVKIHTPQPDPIQGSDTTMAILEVGNHLVEVLVGDIQIMKSHLKTPHLCKPEWRQRLHKTSTSYVQKASKITCGQPISLQTFLPRLCVLVPLIPLLRQPCFL